MRRPGSAEADISVLRRRGVGLSGRDTHIAILLIEDNAGDARLIREMLAEAGGDSLRFERADRLSTGLERLAQGGVDAVLLDLGLPDSHGLETFTRVQEASPDVPVVVLSGLDDEAMRAEAVEAGAKDYLVKGQLEGNLLVRALRSATSRTGLLERLQETRQQRELESTASVLPPLSEERRADFVLIASRDSEFRRKVLAELRSQNRRGAEASGGAEALAKLEEGEFQALVLDRWLPDLDVEELSKTVKAQFPTMEVRIVDSDSAVSCPIVIEDGPQGCPYGRVDSPGRAGSSASASHEGEAAHHDSKPVDALPGMVGASGPMQQVYRLARLVTARSTPVLITGDTGTGKELVARAIHQLGPRARQPMIAVNCAAIPEPLLEAELFGHARGAFTGALQSRMGRIHAAHGGTLFLDEVGEAPLAIQAKLLRFLQDGEVQRLGSSDVIRVDVRVLAATNADLSKRIEEGRFREDLYYRLMVFPISLAPLRARPEDILPLSRFFLSALCQEAAVPSKTISPEAGRVLKSYRWPGNIRELKHKMERAFILSEDSPELLPEHISI